mmetsp:Transcript_150141/g.480721  ORF Transcript_150141/g.480721 Transcript_150141/m.480721 type:complete len:95 (-) Transcript_150141:29-313(-)
MVLLNFNWHPKDLDAVLISSPLARRCEELGLDVKPTWANGAKVFARVAAADVQEVFARAGPGHLDEDEACMGLCPRHVLVREEDEENIWQTSSI